MKITEAQVFDNRFVDNNGYVDWLMDANAQDCISFLKAFYAQWKHVVGRLSTMELRGGLRAIAYAGGLQSKVFWPGSSADTQELLSVMGGSGLFFFDFLSSRDDLAEESSLWWDDLSVVLSYEDDDALDESLDPLRNQLFQLLLRSVDSQSALAQAGGLNGLWNLKHPSSLDELRTRRTGGKWANERLQDEADRLIERLT